MSTTTTFTLTVDGITSPTTHHDLAAATTALVELLGALPCDLPALRRGNLQLLADLEMIRQLMRRDGEVRIDVVTAGRSYEAVIAPSSASA